MAFALSPTLPQDTLDHLVVVDVAPAKGTLSSEFQTYINVMANIEKSGVGNVHSVLLWIQKFLNLCERDSSSDIANPTSDSKVRRIVQRGFGPIHPMLK